MLTLSHLNKRWIERADRGRRTLLLRSIEGLKLLLILGWWASCLLLRYKVIIFGEARLRIFRGYKLVAQPKLLPIKLIKTASLLYNVVCGVARNWRLKLILPAKLRFVARVLRLLKIVVIHARIQRKSARVWHLILYQIWLF